jgi:hypothetical protein
MTYSIGGHDMPAGVIAGAIAGAGAIGAAAIGSSAQKKASQQATQAATDATTQNNALQREIYGQNKEVLQPFYQSGYAANDNINALLGLGGDPAKAQAAFDAYRGSTGYDFRLGEGNKALNASFAARGLSNSGAAAKAALNYGQNIGSAEFGNYLGQLGQQQNVGVGAASALAGLGQNYANNVSSQNNALAGTQANAALANGQSTANLYGTAANALGNVAGSYISSYQPVPRANSYGIVGSGSIY